MSIKAVLFDFDGVLTIDKGGSDSILNYISKKTGIDIEILNTAYYKYNEELLNGVIQHKDIWDSFCRELNRKLDFGILTEAYKDTPIDKEMMDIVLELKAHYKIGMITDNKADRMKFILEYNGWKDLFDVVSVSALAGSRKKDKTLFYQTLEKLNLKADECVFIDNSKRNILAAEEVGIKAIYFNDENRSIEDFKENLRGVLG